MHRKVCEALRILDAIGMPRAQQNERSALCLLAICGIRKSTAWSEAAQPLIGITPIMEFARVRYGKEYAPNTRETVRRQTMHQFVDAGVAAYNPDKPGRPVNSPHAVYQVTAEMQALVRDFATSRWERSLADFRAKRDSLSEQYAKSRDMQQVPLEVGSGQTIRLSPGEHSELIRQIVQVFGPHYAPGGKLLYVGDAGAKWGYFDEDGMRVLGIAVDAHGKMPDVVIHMQDRNWLLLCESVTSHGPVDGKRHDDLKRLFAGSKAGLVFVTAFPSRDVMARYLHVIAWETEVWCAEAPSHLIHFNGTRFLGPY